MLNVERYPRPPGYEMRDARSEIPRPVSSWYRLTLERGWTRAVKDDEIQ